MSNVEINQNFIIIASHNTYFKTCTFVRNFARNGSRTGRILFYLVLIGLLSSCRNEKKQAIDETPTRGNIRIVVDESFQPLVDTEVFTFISLYKNARIKPLYKPEYDVVNDFMNDSVKLMVTSRKLSDSQIQYLRDTLIVARTVTFAYDALALITNKGNPDTLIKYNSVKDIFKGNIRNWNEVNKKSRLGRISVIFDNNKSGNIRYFRELFEIKENLGENFFAVNSNAEVIDYVSKNPDALGIISVNWISDKDDSLSMSFTKKINTLAISQQFINDGYYYRPQPGFIYDRSYPFVREIYFITRETFPGLGSGFLQFATGEQGQKIVLMSGLVPATMPIRLIQIKQ